MIILLQWWHLRHEHIFPGEVFCFCPQLTHNPEKKRWVKQKKLPWKWKIPCFRWFQKYHDGNDDEILNDRFPLCHCWCMQRQRLRNYGNLRLRTNVSVSITKWSVLPTCATIVQHFTLWGHGCMMEVLLVLFWQWRIGTQLQFEENTFPTWRRTEWEQIPTLAFYGIAMHPLLCIDMFSTSPKMHSLASKCALAETDTGTIGNTDTDRDTDTDTGTDA